MAAPASHGFNPLTEFEGRWTTALAELYLPVEGLPPAKYECVDGNLILSPRESYANSFAAMKLGYLTFDAAIKAQLRAVGALNVMITEQRWIEPDFNVVRPGQDGIWIDANEVVMTGEFVSPTSRTRDHIDKPAICAAAGIPYYMTIEISSADKTVRIKLWKLVGGRYRPLRVADAGERFETDEPFPMSFDPVELLDL
ncbi:Uma2 family endonuclease [Kibdelosporangium lantanae]|uniref:Uma2 family endonuclease n=1 Tax=Kibdelosporangium lantanae TaxID=1497396 RepID=A0ABW3MFY4_9PSEU